MKVDGNIGIDLATVADSAREVEAAGYSGAWTAETSHDPFLPLLLAAEHTSELEIGTSIAVAFARYADDARQHGVGPSGLLARDGSSSASAARSSRTSRSASRWSGHAGRPDA